MIANLWANGKDLLNNPQTLVSIIIAGCKTTRMDARNFHNIDGMN